MILLSSYGLCSPIVAEKARAYIEPDEKTVLIIPFAGFNNSNTATREINKGLIPFGFKRENIIVADINEPEKNNEIEPDIIYIPGGNPFKLLIESKKCNIIPRIRELIKNGTDVWGISAGADFCCGDLSYLKLVEDCDYSLENFIGLNIVKDKKILCHVDQRPLGLLQQVKDYDERGILFLHNDEIYVIEEN
jgi:peptidase E